MRPKWFWSIIAAIGLASCGEAAGLSEPTHQIVYQVDEEAIPEDGDRDAVIEAMREVIVARLGAGAPISLHNIELTSDGQIVLDVSGPNAPEAVQSVIGFTGEMTFKLVDQTAPFQDTQQGIAEPGREILPSRDGPAMAVYRLGGIRGRHIVDAKVEADQATGKPVVHIGFDDAGARKLANLTRDNVGAPIAIILDGEIISAPIIFEPVTGGRLQLSGGYSKKEANNLAIALRNGALPVPMKLVSQRELK
ncbi:MAG: hypothetical protein AAGK17_11630 [Pseudomonadota bacterium]